MNEILEILSDLHPDIDFKTEKNLVDNKILDSFEKTFCGRSGQRRLPRKSGKHPL